MAAEVSLFDLPPTKGHKRAASSIRSFKSNKSIYSKASTASVKSDYCDLLGMRTKPKDITTDTSSSSRLSIVSGVTGSTTSSDASTLTNTSKSSKSSTSMTEHDVFGTKLPPTEEELAPSLPDAVELESGKYRVPEPIDKQFFKDLTCLEDDELVRKYGLTRVGEEEDRVGGKRKGEGKLRRLVRESRIGMGMGMG